MKFIFHCTAQGFECIVIHNGNQVVIPYERVPMRVKERFEAWRPLLKAMFDDGGRLYGQQGSVIDRIERAKGAT